MLKNEMQCIYTANNFAKYIAKYTAKQRLFCYLICWEVKNSLIIVEYIWKYYLKQEDKEGVFVL